MRLAASPQPAARIIPAKRVNSKFSPEFEWLLEICKDPETAAFHVGPSAIDWQKLYALSDHHGLIPLVYEALLRGRHAVPVAALDNFRLRSLTNARQTLWFTAALTRITQKLKGSGISVLPYKGPTLAHLLYSSPSARQYSDLDLLVRTKDVRAAKAILRELDYTPHHRFTAAQERSQLRSGYECVFDAAHGRNLVELQWQIVPRFYSVRFDIDDLFARATPIKIENSEYQTLCPEDLLLVLCVHAAKHGWTKLSWLMDVTELASSHISDLDAVRESATTLGVRRIVAVTFLLAETVLGKSIPHGFKSLTEDDAAQGIARQLLPVIAAGEEWDTTSATYVRLMLRSRERWRDRAQFLGRLLFTPSAGEWDVVRLPAVLSPLYYLVRMFRLVSRAMATSSTPPGSAPSR
jgi:hypothetical protein